jgi:hypothetical protein
MEFRVGRPQKPFTVEVKRGRKGSVSARPAILAKKPAPAVAAVPERRPVAPPPEPPKPQRRILDAIEPEPKLSIEPAIEVAPADPFKPRRGRPPKAARPATPESEQPRVAKKAEARARKVESRVRKVEASIPPRARREVSRAPEIVAVPVAPPRELKTAHLAQVQAGHAHVAHARAPHGHVTHGDRVEAATSLPRGERWKRRLPKVLW